MASILEILAKKITDAKAHKVRIRDRLAQADWNSIVDKTASMSQIADAIEGINTYPEQEGDSSIPIGPETTTGPYYNIPKGYHDGTEVVSWVDVDDNGQQIGLLYSHPNVTPKKGEIVKAEIPKGYWGLYNVTVNPIPDPYHDVSSVNMKSSWVLPSGIYVDKNGEARSGTMSTVENKAPYNIQLTPAKRKHTFKVNKYYYPGEDYTVEVQDSDLEELTFTPTDNKQEVLANTNNKFITKVTVNPIPETYVDGNIILQRLERL
jgi:hypothetical protein